jgi:hypothetical protein
MSTIGKSSKDCEYMHKYILLILNLQVDDMFSKVGRKVYSSQKFLFDSWISQAKHLRA